MRLDELHYELPSELIARYPPPQRDASRLMVVSAEGLAHRNMHGLCALLPERALLVVNDTRVIPARLFGHKEATGGKVEVLLVRRLNASPDGAPASAETPQRWLAMARSSRRIAVDTVLVLGDGLRATIEREVDSEGLLQLRLETRDGQAVADVLAREGHMPLPPYMGRPDEIADRERYQTRFAREPGAVAAPTAGLHFSERLIAQLEAQDALCAITLHVGPGTFRPVTVDDLDDHRMHEEHYAVAVEAARAINAARAQGRPIIAVGTTVVRALESAASDDGTLTEGPGETRLLIQPGYRFKVVDGLITNFHLPGSTLLALVYALGGTTRVQEAYRAAIAEKYRFYSYGDAMFFPPSESAGQGAS